MAPDLPWLKDDPATIPTADFEREGRTYTLLDLLKNDQTETDTREHIEVVTLENTDSAPQLPEEYSSSFPES